MFFLKMLIKEVDGVYLIRVFNNAFKISNGHRLNELGIIIVYLNWHCFCNYLLTVNISWIILFPVKLYHNVFFDFNASIEPSMHIFNQTLYKNNKLDFLCKVDSKNSLFCIWIININIILFKLLSLSVIIRLCLSEVLDIFINEMITFENCAFSSPWFIINLFDQNFKKEHKNKVTFVKRNEPKY